MEIKKFTKKKGNTYLVTIDDEEYKLYDDTIIKFNMLQTKTITSSKLEEVLLYDKELTSYYLALKYLTRRMRTEYEIRAYLKQRDYEESIIDKTIAKLYKTHYLNEENYLKCYINDALKLTNKGPKKIIHDLAKLGIDSEKVRAYLDNIDETIWHSKIDEYIKKKIKNNKNSSANRLRLKIVADLTNLGYDREQIMDILHNYPIDDTSSLKNDIIKEKKKLAKKYTGPELLNHLKLNLYRKGYTDIEEYLHEE